VHAHAQWLILSTVAPCPTRGATALRIAHVTQHDTWGRRAMGGGRVQKYRRGTPARVAPHITRRAFAREITHRASALGGGGAHAGSCPNVRAQRVQKPRPLRCRVCRQKCRATTRPLATCTVAARQTTSVEPLRTVVRQIRRRGSVWRSSARHSRHPCTHGHACLMPREHHAS